MILLLGATGLLGHNTLKLLLERGYAVRCIIREGSEIDPEVLSCAGQGQLETVRGSILDNKLLMSSLWGCDAAVNCAGVTDMSLSRLEDYRPVNTVLPQTLARMLYETGGRTLVDISTANTIAPGTAASPADESAPFGWPFSASLYARSKRESEQALAAFAEEHSRPRIVILLPGFMIGPYDRKPSSGKLLTTAYREPVMAVPRGGKSFVDARDVAAAILGAIENPQAHGRYLATGTALTLKEFYELQARVCGYRQLCFTIPNAICRAVASVGDARERKGRSSLAVSRNIQQLQAEEWYDNSRARLELGMPQTPIEQSIKDFFAYVCK